MEKVQQSLSYKPTVLLKFVLEIKIVSNLCYLLWVPNGVPIKIVDLEIFYQNVFRMATPELLPDSELGTKEHWESVYETEIANHDEIGDDGECWFGEEAMYRMIRKLEVRFFF